MRLKDYYFKWLKDNVIFCIYSIKIMLSQDNISCRYRCKNVDGKTLNTLGMKSKLTYSNKVEDKIGQNRTKQDMHINTLLLFHTITGTKYDITLINNFLYKIPERL